MQQLDLRFLLDWNDKRRHPRTTGYLHRHIDGLLTQTHHLFQWVVKDLPDQSRNLESHQNRLPPLGFLRRQRHVTGSFTGQIYLHKPIVFVGYLAPKPT